jgi:hypothetical protein
VFAIGFEGVLRRKTTKNKPQTNRTKDANQQANTTTRKHPNPKP